MLEAWEVCDCTNLGIYRTVERQEYQLAISSCFCTRRLVKLTADHSADLLASDIEISNAEGCLVFSGKHLWFDQRRLLFRSKNISILEEHLWTDVDRGIMNNGTLRNFNDKSVADVLLEGSSTLILMSDGSVVRENSPSPIT